MILSIGRGKNGLTKVSTFGFELSQYFSARLIILQILIGNIGSKRITGSQ
jgi:hypothetical protein